MNLKLLTKFLFIEHCRGCGKFVEYQRDKNLETICLSCFAEIKQSAAKLLFCPFDDEYSAPVIGATAYAGLVKKLIYHLKYDGDCLVANDLVRLLIEAEELKSCLAEKEYVITPVPLHWFRKYKRGYNQADLIAKQIARHFKLRYMPQLLTRKKTTKAHHNLSAAERKLNVHNAFQANAEFVSGKNILLVDDIYTSGATFAEIFRILMAAGAHSVIGASTAFAVK